VVTFVSNGFQHADVATRWRGVRSRFKSNVRLVVFSMSVLRSLVLSRRVGAYEITRICVKTTLYQRIELCRLLQNGNTALIMASGRGHKATVQALIRAGADCSIRNKV
jgi:hypothetical protein